MNTLEANGTSRADTGPGARYHKLLPTPSANLPPHKKNQLKVWAGRHSEGSLAGKSGKLTFELT